MPKRAASESVHSDSSTLVKDESSTPPPVTPKKAKKSPSASISGSSSKKESLGNGMPGSLAKTPRGRYMELIFEAGLKAVNKKAVQDEVSAPTNGMYEADILDRLACHLISKQKWSGRIKVAYEGR